MLMGNVDMTEKDMRARVIQDLSALIVVSYSG